MAQISMTVCYDKNITNFYSRDCQSRKYTKTKRSNLFHCVSQISMGTGCMYDEHILIWHPLQSLPLYRYNVGILHLEGHDMYGQLRTGHPLFK